LMLLGITISKKKSKTKEGHSDCNTHLQGKERVQKN